MKNHLVRRLALVYAAVSWLSLIVLLVLAAARSSDFPYGLGLLLFLLPLLTAIICRILAKRAEANTDRAELLAAAMRVKLGHLPLVLLGLALGVFLFLEQLRDPKGMALLAGFGIGIISVLSGLYLIGSALFSIPYCKRARRDGVCSSMGAAAATLCQFLLGLDVLAVLLLSLREKKYRIKISDET